MITIKEYCKEISSIDEYCKQNLVSEYLSTKVKINNHHTITDIKNILDKHNISFVDSQDDDTFNEIKYHFTYSQEFFDLVKSYFLNNRSEKLKKELRDYTNFDKGLNILVNPIYVNTGNNFYIDINDYKNRLVFINCIYHNTPAHAGETEILIVIKKDSKFDLYENTYILLKYLFDNTIS